MARIYMLPSSLWAVDESKGLEFHQPLPQSAQRLCFWSREAQGKRMRLSGSMLPQFKLAPEVLQAVWQLAKGPGRLSGALIGTKSSPYHYLSVNVEDCRWQVKSSARSIGDYMVTLVPNKAENSDLQAAWERLTQEISAKTDDVPIEPLQVCKTFCGFVALQGPPRLVLRFSVLHPAVPLFFTPVPQVKIVSTALSVQLVKDTKRATKCLTGYLTQDQSKRIVVLLPSDPNTAKYPMAGIWATGLPKLVGPVSDKHRQFPFCHPLVWAAAVRYLQTSAIRSRISPSPESHTFLFIYFDPIPRFYEVTAGQGAEWKVTNIEKIVQVDNQPATVTMSLDEEKSEGSVSSSQDLADTGLPSTASSSVDLRDSLFPVPSVPILRSRADTSDHSQDLHRNGQTSQPVLARPKGLGTARKQPELTINTTSLHLDESLSRTPTKRMMALTPMSARGSGDSNILRFSADESSMASHKLSIYHTDCEPTRLPPVSELPVPRITYQALSDSSEDEAEERSIQNKYLKQPVLR